MEKNQVLCINSRHIQSINFTNQEAKRTLGDNIILNKLSWDNIPDFAIITGKNGAGKTKLLEYTATVLKKNHSEIFVIHEVGFLDSTANVLELQKTDEKMEESLRNAAIKFLNGGEKFSKYFKGLKYNKDFKDELKKAKKDGADINSYIDKLIDFSIHDYKSELHDLTNPVETLNLVFKIFDQKYQYLKAKYLDGIYFKEIRQFCKNKYSKEKKAQLDEIILDKKTLLNLIEEYVQEKLHPKLPWEEFNKLLVQASISLKVIWDNSGDVSQKKIAFRHNNGSDINISFQELSSGEKMLIKLAARVFYFQGFDAFKVNLSADIKKINIMLLDEPDCHLDPPFCVLLHNLIQEHIVKNCNIQVIMSTHRLDTVKLAQEKSVFVMERELIKCSKDSAITNMISSTNRIALSILSEGKMSINLDSCNYVIVENKDDMDFFTVIYDKFKKSKLLDADNPKLVFIPVGISVIETKNIEKIENASSKLNCRKLDFENIIQELENDNKDIQTITSTLQEHKSNNQTFEQICKELEEEDDLFNNIKQKFREFEKTIELVTAKLLVQEQNIQNARNVLKNFKEHNINIYNLLNKFKGNNDVGGGVEKIKKSIKTYYMKPVYDDKNTLKELVKEYVWIKSFCGLADGDGKTIDTESKKFLRINFYSIECYLCLPINLMFVLKKYHETMISIEKENNMRPSEESKEIMTNDEFQKVDELCKEICKLYDNKSKQNELTETLEKCIEFVVKFLLRKRELKNVSNDKTKNLLDKFCSSLKSPTNSEITLINGIRVRCENSFLKGLDLNSNKKGHDLFNAVRYLIGFPKNCFEHFLKGLSEVPSALLPNDLLQNLNEFIWAETDDLKVQTGKNKKKKSAPL